MNLLCNITNEKFEFVQLNLKSLAEKIKAENNITDIDVLKYCKELSYYYDNLQLEVAEINRELTEEEQNTLIQKEDEYRAFSDYVTVYYASPYKESLRETLKRIESDYDEGKEFLKAVGFLHKVIDGLSSRVYLYEKMTDLSKIKQRYVDIYTDYLKKLIQNRTTLDMKYRCDTYPIIINIRDDNFRTSNSLNDKKIELIDGFQRLFTYNPSDLDFYGIVKVYHNLSDENYVKVLNAANNWKMISNNQNKLCDGGYLFALEQRFGKESFKNIYGLDVVSILNAYNQKIPQYVDNQMFFKDLDTIRKIINTEFPIDEDTSLSKQIVLYTLKIMGIVRQSKNFNDYDFVEMFDNTIWSLKTKLQRRYYMETQGHIENFLEKEVLPKYKEFLSRKKTS